MEGQDPNHLVQGGRCTIVSARYCTGKRSGKPKWTRWQQIRIPKSNACISDGLPRGLLKGQSALTMHPLGATLHVPAMLV